MTGTGTFLQSEDTDRLIFEDVAPLVQRIVRFRLATSATAQDREDVVSDVLLELFTRVSRRGEPIADIQGYAAVASHHGCDQYLRRRFPLRDRLRNRVRYLLENSAQYALWRDQEGFICALATYKEQPLASLVDPHWVSEVPIPGMNNMSEPALVKAILEYAAAPIRLPVLVDAMAGILNIRDYVASTTDLDIAAPEAASSVSSGDISLLRRLWHEITELPRAQRFALLMNLRNEDGSCALSSFPATGIASIRVLAEVLELPAVRLAELWKSLPISDAAIAEMLSLTRQQVINLRKSARQRLARRLKYESNDGNIRPISPSKKVTAINA